MSNPLLEISSKDERLANLLRDNKQAPPQPSTPVERKTFKVKSDLLARLEDFLPKIKEANAQLDQKFKQDPKAVDIENVDEESGEQYIEMDLGLGVYDLKRDVEDDGIIMNPNAATSEPALKPTIIMMDTDKDISKLSIESDSDSDMEHDGSSKKQTIPSATADSSKEIDDDIVMA